MEFPEISKSLRNLESWTCKLSGAIIALICGSVSREAFSAGGLPAQLSYYDFILHGVGIDHRWYPTVGALLVTLVLIAIGLYYKKTVERAGSDVAPGSRFSLRFLVESILEGVLGLSKDNCADKYRNYFPFLATIFIFVLACNLTGLIPGFPPPTVSIDNNIAMGLVVLVVYNYAGIKEHGGSYIKHFLGPAAFIAPLFFAIELVSHASRPLSLGLRLTANIYGDHTLVSVFTSLSYVLFPALLLFFGLLIAVVQSFVYTLLTGIYISMAISHDH